MANKPLNGPLTYAQFDRLVEGRKLEETIRRACSFYLVGGLSISEAAHAACCSKSGLVAAVQRLTKRPLRQARQSYTVYTTPANAQRLKLAVAALMEQFDAEDKALVASIAAQRVDA